MKQFILFIKEIFGYLITIVGWISYIKLFNSPKPFSSDSFSDIAISIFATLYFLEKSFKSVTLEHDLKDPFYFQSSVIKKDLRPNLTQKDFDNYYQTKRRKRKR